jgi:hypothetical protein
MFKQKICKKLMTMNLGNPMQLNRQLIGAVACGLLLLASCEQNKLSGETLSEGKQVVLPAPLKPDHQLDSNSEYAKHWTGLHEWLKLNDHVILKVPPQFSGFLNVDSNSKNYASFSEVQPEKIRQVPTFGFGFHMPDFVGITPDNYQKEFDEDAVGGYIEPASINQAEPESPGYYPPNMFKRLSESLDMTNYQEKYGLRCYDYVNEPNGVGHRQYCYGLRDNKIDEYILLDIYAPPYPDWVKQPTMQATYFTKQYGGLVMTWSAHVKYFDRWQEIDRQMWQYLDKWNVVNKHVLTLESTTKK